MTPAGRAALIRSHALHESALYLEQLRLEQAVWVGQAEKGLAWSLDRIAALHRERRELQRERERLGRAARR